MNKKEIEFLIRENCPFHELKDHTGQSLKKLLTAYDFDGKTGCYDVLYCPLCDIGITSPYPSEETLHLLYLNPLSRNFDGNNSLLFSKLKDSLAKTTYLNLEKKLKRKFDKILDFGTGNGRHAIVLKSMYKNSQVDAVDFNLNPPQMLENQKDINYYHIDDFYMQGKKYDLILLRHVLEHVSNPIQFIEKFRDYLEEDGILYIEVPNLKSGNAKIFGKYYSGYYVPYHLFHYTKASLELILKEAGYNCTIHKAEIPTMSNVFANILGAGAINNYLKILGMFLHPLQLFNEKIFNSSTVLVAIANKKD